MLLHATITVDEVERDDPLVVVNNEAQDVDVLIGQSFTELADVLTTKTGHTL